MQFGNSKWPQLLYLDCVLKDSFIANLLKCNIMDWPLFTIDWPILLYTHSSEEQQASLNLLLNQCLSALQCLWPQCLKLKSYMWLHAHIKYVLWLLSLKWNLCMLQGGDRYQPEGEQHAENLEMVSVDKVEAGLQGNQEEE